MKQSIALSLVLALSVAVPAVSHAQSGGMKDMDMAKKAAAGTQAAHKATGVVKKVDAKTGTVTLAHDPVKSLNWPAMTMDFRVRDKASLATLKPEQKIEFELIEEKKGSYVINRIK
jgi:Cu/Ag efflux protein CusF